uniref:Uncharacterized protein n=1 Tax=Anguilla anguilla TaxID=7936 RepID=A0A0E9PB99_ANGAN
MISARGCHKLQCLPWSVSLETISLHCLIYKWTKFLILLFLNSPFVDTSLLRHSVPVKTVITHIHTVQSLVKTMVVLFSIATH